MPGRGGAGLAVLVALLVQGVELDAALEAVSVELARHEGHGETLKAIDHARKLAGNGPGSVDMLVQLGQGWVAEETPALELRQVIREVADDLASTPDWPLDDDSLEGESAFYWRR